MKRKIRLTIFAHSETAAGGGEVALLELIDAIKAEVDICVILPRAGQIQRMLANENVKTEIVDIPWWVRHDVIAVGPRRHARVTKSLKGLRKHLDTFRPDVCMTNTSVIPWGAVAARMKGVPHIWYIHEMIDEKSEIKYEPGLDLVTQLIDQLSDKVIANGEYCENTLGNDMSQAKIMTISPILHLGLQNKKMNKPPLLYKTIRATKEPIILIPARIVDGKGQMDAVKSIKNLHDQQRPTHLVLIGTSEELYRKKIEAYAVRNHIVHLIHILPFVDNPQPYIACADIVLNTSRLESYGRSTLEAMHAGTPVIGANNSATGYIIDDGVNGMKYKTGDDVELTKKIKMVLDDHTLRKTIGDGGMQYAVRQLKSTQKVLELFPDTLRELVSTTHTPDLALEYISEVLDVKADNVRVGENPTVPQRDTTLFKVKRITQKIIRRIKRLI